MDAHARTIVCVYACDRTYYIYMIASLARFSSFLFCMFIRQFQYTNGPIDWIYINIHWIRVMDFGIDQWISHLFMFTHWLSAPGNADHSSVAHQILGLSHTRFLIIILFFIFLDWNQHYCFSVKRQDIFITVSVPSFFF